MTWRRFFVTLVRNSGRSLVIVVAQELIEQPLPRRGSPLDYHLELAEEDHQPTIPQGGRERDIGYRYSGLWSWKKNGRVDIITRG